MVLILDQHTLVFSDVLAGLKYPSYYPVREQELNYMVGVSYAWNPDTGETEAKGRPQREGQPRLQSEKL